ncbi:DUF397 domain-containing protein [Actinomadura sp. LD22]|uniref:DUF397 domain-containing protein n=1 Tax=Actinomadura physcomitrii TaxID=2650748 RepID=A0A6I4MJ66_9ACTN|nr:DUF397 domain-containing protein [Actinomadura physcomitrii]MWA04027.1 DUF397 domain-containing protein [Actinomadura physcomitrii]
MRAQRHRRHSANDGACIEVAADEAAVLARDSKDPDGPVLDFSGPASTSPADPDALTCGVSWLSGAG